MSRTTAINRPLTHDEINAGLKTGTIKPDKYDSAKAEYVWDALEVTCKTCKGDGSVQSPEWRRWMKDNKDRMSAAITEGSAPTTAEHIQCPECEGLCYLPTAFGKAILLFMKRHFKEPTK